MNLTYKKLKKPKNTNTYFVKIETMTGDADDYHTLNVEFNEKFVNQYVDDKDYNLRNCIIACEILAKQYPRGCGGCDTYDGLPYWDVFFADDDEWHYDCNCDRRDTFSSYEVFFYNENGIKHKVEVEFDDEMKAEIDSAEVYGRRR
jgi:hypothetical protein